MTETLEGIARSIKEKTSEIKAAKRSLKTAETELKELHAEAMRVLAENSMETFESAAGTLSVVVSHKVTLDD
jgi:hypothetical protein